MATSNEKSTGRSRLLKDAAASLSLANLCFITSWNDLLDSSPRDAFNVYNYSSFVTIMLNVLLLGGLLWSALTVARRSSNPLPLKIARWLLPGILLIPLNGALTILIPDFSLLKLFASLKVGYFNRTEQMVLGTGLTMLAAFLLARRFKAATGVAASTMLLLLGRPEPIWFALLLAILFLFVQVRWHRVVLRASTTSLLVLAPFVLITFFQAVSFGARFADRTPAPVINRTTGATPRVLWMVFDEMDQSLTFTRRHSVLNLPEIDRLRSEAVYASNVYPPSDSTLISMPAMITGRLISKAKVAGPSEVMLTYAGSDEAVKWSTQPNIFSEARSYGVNSAVIGWYHPYCRILGQDLTFCSYQEFGRKPFGQVMTEQIKSMVRTVPLASYYGVFEEKDPEQQERRRRFKESYSGILDQARRAAVDPDVGLLLIHWPIPHPPAIFNHVTNELDLSRESGYVGNLALVDRTLGELRREMEAAGLWDETIVLVTSDHWFRSEMHFRTKEDAEALAGPPNHRVPFMLKLAGQKQRVDYDGEFNNVLAHDLLLALLRGELKSPESVKSWLDTNRSVGESPYNFQRED
jgi:hypothetical protein